MDGYIVSVSLWSKFCCFLPAHFHHLIEKIREGSNPKMAILQSGKEMILQYLSIWIKETYICFNIG